MNRPRPPCPAPALPMLAAACVLLAAAPPASAGPYLSVSQSFTHDDNLFREPDGGFVESDTISTTGLKLGIDEIRLGRQRLNASVAGNLNRFRDHSQLDNNGHGIDLRLDWATLARLSGQVRYGRERRLSSFADSRSGALLRRRNMLTTEDLSGRAQLGATSQWVLEANAARREQRYSAPEFRNREIRQNSLGAGVRWQPSDLLGIGLGLRNTDGRNPHFTPGGASNSFDRRDVDLTLHWRYSGLTTINGRLSRTRTDHSLAGARDYSGTTGALGIDWRPTGRTAFNLQFSRETNDESAFVRVDDDNDPETPPLDPALVEAPLVDSRLSNTLRLRVFYALTGKISLDAGVSHSRRRLEESVPVAGGGTALLRGRDRSTGLNLGASYAVSRGIHLGCGVARERRSAEGPRTVTAPFHANTVSCQAQLTLQ